MQSAGSEMGEEIETAGFTRDDFLRFADRLIEETEIARGLFVTDGFSQSGHTLGFEIECWILDHNYFPASINQRLLETLANPLERLQPVRPHVPGDAPGRQGCPRRRVRSVPPLCAQCLRRHGAAEHAWQPPTDRRSRDRAALQQ